MSCLFGFFGLLSLWLFILFLGSWFSGIALLCSTFYFTSFILFFYFFFPHALPLDFVSFYIVSLCCSELFALPYCCSQCPCFFFFLVLFPRLTWLFFFSVWHWFPAPLALLSRAYFSFWLVLFLSRPCLCILVVCLLCSPLFLLLSLRSSSLSSPWRLPSSYHAFTYLTLAFWTVHSYILPVLASVLVVELRLFFRCLAASVPGSYPDLLLGMTSSAFPSSREMFCPACSRRLLDGCQLRTCISAGGGRMPSSYPFLLPGTDGEFWPASQSLATFALLSHRIQLLCCSVGGFWFFVFPFIVSVSIGHIGLLSFFHLVLLSLLLLFLCSPFSFQVSLFGFLFSPFFFSCLFVCLFLVCFPFGCSFCSLALGFRALLFFSPIN
ncbi:uncharacterized protein LOC125697150 [Lagopus muta]|uniref:uncharacterized protein LOC125697150 n=1 Tax=Lagopus muta TaxID=64668 RepID=UPI0020A1EA1F|nr:uncharacterized protein LOC125697150 [Lagopus muta]XP_048809882.1 uncharacterized protein LOC125697150 [Lagopus muta]XP_048809883.1 uncharacterized protein LOC125697150 [Lagopus muta]XP_048809884.1 uncharacterized protein LOC125697150 [Lagopus muta]XP_048809885.1 uncharacterized protein LOC125697150 [Lagopus muta]